MQPTRWASIGQTVAVPVPNDAATTSPALDVGDLVGRHVALERLSLDHVDEIARAGTGDRSTFAFTNVPADEHEAKVYVDTLLGDASRLAGAPFIQRSRSDGALVGCTRYLHPAWPLGRSAPDEVEIGGTWLVGSAQRSPINTEAKLLLLNQAFDIWCVRRVAICTDHRNERSRRAIERIGGTYEGTLREHRRSTALGEHHQLRDTAVYSITCAEWPDVRERLLVRVG
jgi:N-acetyltransferase